MAARLDAALAKNVQIEEKLKAKDHELFMKEGAYWILHRQVAELEGQVLLASTPVVSMSDDFAI